MSASLGADAPVESPAPLPTHSSLIPNPRHARARVNLAPPLPPREQAKPLPEIGDVARKLVNGDEAEMTGANGGAAAGTNISEKTKLGKQQRLRKPQVG